MPPVASVRRLVHALLITAVMGEYIERHITRLYGASTGQTEFQCRNEAYIPGIRLFHPRGDNREKKLLVNVAARKFYKGLFSP